MRNGSADSMILNNEDVENSFYKDIKSLPLGHILEAGTDYMRLESRSLMDSIKEIRFPCDADYVDAANEIFFPLYCEQYARQQNACRYAKFGPRLFFCCRCGTGISCQTK